MARLNDLYASTLVRQGTLVPVLQEHFTSPHTDWRAVSASWVPVHFKTL